MPSPPPVIRRSSSFDDNYDEPEEEEENIPRNVSFNKSVPVGGRYGTLPNSRPLPPEDNYENDEDDFSRRKSNPPPTLPPKRLSERHTEKKEKAPSVRAQPAPRPVKCVPPSLPLKTVKVNTEDGNAGAGMYLPPTLNPITVAKMQKLKGVNQKMAGSELFKKRQELEKAIGNLN